MEDGSGHALEQVCVCADWKNITLQESGKVLGIIGNPFPVRKRISASLRPGEPPFDDLTHEDQSWLMNAFTVEQNRYPILGLPINAP